MGSLIVVTGPPGAGKSTLAGAMARASDHSVLVEGDAFFGFLGSGRTEPWLTESHEQNRVVTTAAASAAGRYAAGGYTTVYDGVIGPWFLPTFTEATGLDQFDYLILMPSVERCVQGVASRFGHGFRNEAATRKMHAEFAKAKVAARHVLHDPPHHITQLVELVTAAAERGDLAHRRTA